MGGSTSTSTYLFIFPVEVDVKSFALYSDPPVAVPDKVETTHTSHNTLTLLKLYGYFAGPVQKSITSYPGIEDSSGTVSIPVAPSFASS